MSVHSIVQSNNYQLLVHRSRGEWLEADSEGQLHILRGREKIWFAIRNFFCFNSLTARTASSINDCCQKLFRILCTTSPAPLDPNSPEIHSHKEAILDLLKAVKRIKPSLYNKEIWRDLKHLLDCPEIIEAKLALEQGIKPIPMEEGINGSYVLANRLNQPCGIFKPAELEAGSCSNPKGYYNIENFLNQMGIRSGTSYLRERAAYLLDKQHFANVPQTLIVRIPRKYFGLGASGQTYKGSFQKFVPNSSHAWDHYSILPSFFSGAQGHKIPVHEIHKIAILDLRTLNCDRHLKNFLIDPSWHAHPIDHGFTLPAKVSSLRFNWMYFNQSKQPFSKEDLNYIAQLDPEADAAFLQRKLPQLGRECLSRIKIAGMLLKKGAQANLTPYQIGELMIGKKDSLSDWIHWFLPIPSKGESYFETNICQPILRRKEKDIESFLDREIHAYLNS